MITPGQQELPSLEVYLAAGYSISGSVIPTKPIITITMPAAGTLAAATITVQEAPISVVSMAAAGEGISVGVAGGGGQVVIGKFEEPFSLLSYYFQTTLILVSDYTPAYLWVPLSSN